MEKLRNHVRYVYNARLATPSESVRIDTTKELSSSVWKRDY
jgi:hypothetical protein